MLLCLCWLLAGMGVLNLQDAAHGVIGVGGGAAISLGDGFDAPPACGYRPGV